MAALKKKIHEPGNGDRAKGRAAEHGTENAEDSCRCREVSQKTFPDLLRLMISDLAFWKKSRKIHK